MAEAPLTEPPLTDAEIAALGRLARLGSECVGKVNSQEKLSAVMTLVALLERGLADGIQGPEGPVFSLTSAGRAALDDAEGMRAE